MSIKVALICQVPLPNLQIGSWPKLIDYYFKENSEVKITDIICPDFPLSISYSNVKYHITKKNYLLKVWSKISKTRHQHFVNKSFEILSESKDGVVFLIIR